MNAEVDVVIVVADGEGELTVAAGPSAAEPTVSDAPGRGVQRREPMRSGQLFLICNGARRAIAAGPSGLTYLTCHRRRARLMPRRAPRT